MADKEEALTLKGEVVETQKSKFKVRIFREGIDPETEPEADRMYVQAYLAGKLRKHKIRIVLGDKVTVDVTPYDLTQGRITYREK